MYKKYLNDPKFCNRLALIFGIISALSGYLYTQVNLVPIAPSFGIIALAFAMISKNLGSDIKKRIVSMILAWAGIIISVSTYILIIYYYTFIRNNLEPMPELTMLMKLLGVI